jgi:hypothetical protein
MQYNKKSQRCNAHESQLQIRPEAMTEKWQQRSEMNELHFRNQSPGRNFSEPITAEEESGENGLYTGR